MDKRHLSLQADGAGQCEYRGGGWLLLSKKGP